VQAGTGISVASGTGPIPVVTNTMATAIDAEGDLIIGDAADAFQRLAIGSNTHVLTVDTSVDGKIKWAAPAGGGKVLQVVYGNYSTSTLIASTTFTDTGLNLSITPTSATSKVYIFATQLVRIGRSSNENIAAFKILRGATTVFNTDTGSSTGGYTGFGGGGAGLTSYVGVNQVPLQYLDSPATTSSTNYKIQLRLITTANSADAYAQYESGNSSICLMEIGA
jgi:hypothetical protein